MLLTQACEREDLKIVAVNTDYRHKRHLENLSILKGETITCLYNRTGDIVIRVKDGRIAINREFACQIEVESLNPQYFETYHVSVGVGQKRHSEERRRPTKEALVFFKEEDQKMIEQEKAAKRKLKEIREQKKADLDKEKNHD